MRESATLPTNYLPVRIARVNSIHCTLAIHEGDEMARRLRNPQAMVLRFLGATAHLERYLDRGGTLTALQVASIAIATGSLARRLDSIKRAGSKTALVP